MSALSLTEFVDEVSEIMPAITRELYKQVSDEFYKIHITLPQFVVLDILDREGEMRMTDLAAIMNVSTAAVTGIVDRLVKCGYVERVNDPGDRRIIKVRQTHKGRRIMRNAVEQRKLMFRKMFEVISNTEREVYLRILRHIRKHIKEQEHRFSQ